MTKSQIIKNISAQVRKKFEHEGTGHDWYHIERVWKMAKRIARKEKGVDVFIVELGALLHDIADWKFYPDDPHAGSETSSTLLKKLAVGQETIAAVSHIVDNVSFKGGTKKNHMQSLEGKIVQDADRLDAIGAIGIARVFAYGGYKQRSLHQPGAKPVKFKSFGQYKKHAGTSINHFYEKLLLVKDCMNTRAGRKMALHRHAYLENFLKEFFSEWEGKA